MQSQCMLPEDAITSFSWCANLIFYPVSHLPANMSFQTFYPFIDQLHKMIKLISIVKRSCLKGSYSSENVDLDPLFIYDDAISLISDQFY